MCGYACILATAALFEWLGASPTMGMTWITFIYQSI